MVRVCMRVCVVRVFVLCVVCCVCLPHFVLIMAQETMAQLTAAVRQVVAVVGAWRLMRLRCVAQARFPQLAAAAQVCVVVVVVVVVCVLISIAHTMLGLACHSCDIAVAAAVVSTTSVLDVLQARRVTRGTPGRALVAASASLQAQ